jgi:hypothetical protein
MAYYTGLHIGHLGESSMRKFLVLAGLAVAAALVASSPAKAVLGCGCFKLGSPMVCTATVNDCMSKVGGLCGLPCDYTPPKMTKKSKKKKM